MTGCVIAFVAEKTDALLLSNFLDFSDGVLGGFTGDHFRENAPELGPIPPASSFSPRFGVSEVSQVQVVDVGGRERFGE